MNFPFLTNSLTHPLKMAKKFFVDAPLSDKSQKSPVFFLFCFFQKNIARTILTPCGFFLECYTDITLVSTIAFNSAPACSQLHSNCIKIKCDMKGL